MQAAEDSLRLPLGVAQDDMHSRGETGSDTVPSYVLSSSSSSSVPTLSGQGTAPNVPLLAPEPSLLLHPHAPESTGPWVMTTASSSHGVSVGQAIPQAFIESQSSCMDEDQLIDEYMALADSPGDSSSMDIDSDDLYTPQFGGESPSDLVLFDDYGSRSPSMAVDDALPSYTSMLPKARWTAATEPEDRPVAMDISTAPLCSPSGRLSDWQSSLAPPSCSSISHLIGLPLPFAANPSPQGQSYPGASPDLLPPIELVSTGSARSSRSRTANRRRALPYDASLRRGRRQAPEVPDYHAFFGFNASQQAQEDSDIQTPDEPFKVLDRERRSQALSPSRQLFLIDQTEAQPLSSVDTSTSEVSTEHLNLSSASDAFSSLVEDLESSAAAEVSVYLLGF